MFGRFTSENFSSFSGKCKLFWCPHVALNILKKAEHQTIDAFELQCWRRLLGIPWTARRSKQSILKDINPKYSLEGLMLKWQLQYFGYLMWRTDSVQSLSHVRLFYPLLASELCYNRNCPLCLGEVIQWIVFKLRDE